MRRRLSGNRSRSVPMWASLYYVPMAFSSARCAPSIPKVQPESITQELELLDLLGGLLSGVLQAEMNLVSEARRVERAEVEALSDGLTGLFNRRGWTRLLGGEEARCRRYGHSAGGIVVDLDNLKWVNDSAGHFAGDELLARAASVMTAVKRSPDVVARVGGDEFTLLAVDATVQAPTSW